MDKIDILTVPTPIFITNPRPNFIIPQKSKIMLLVENKENVPKDKKKSKDIIKNLNDNLENKMNLNNKKELKKEEFDRIIENLRKKFHSQIDEMKF